MAAPLNQLLKADKEFQWTELHSKALAHLKEVMSKPPVLCYPDLNRDYIITTDASFVAISYILGQLDDSNKEQVVCYGGRSLTSAERKWAIPDLECFALIQALKEYYPYVATRKITCYTDHLSLRYLNNLKINHQKGKYARWILYLKQFDLNIVYRPGHRNQADALSRREYEAPTKEEVNDPSLPCVFSIDLEPEHTQAMYEESLAWDFVEPFIGVMDSLSSLQQSDEKLKDMIN